MKRFFLLFVMAVLLSYQSVAERVTPENARKAAQTFFSNNGAKGSQLRDVSNLIGFANLYVFSDAQGFVLMSADDCVKPILAYSMTNAFDAENMPENIRFWLSDYDFQIQKVVEIRAQASPEVSLQWRDLISGKGGIAKSDVVVDALIQTRWNQSAPYNNFCPMALDYNGSEARTVTGCVATAMAQVMKFWNHPAVGTGSHSYTPWNSAFGTNFGTLYANFSDTHYDWYNMPNVATTSSLQIEQDAVATLMYHCGVSVNMGYDVSNAGGSGAYSGDVATALIRYFDYKNSIGIRYRSYYTDEDWMSMLKSELNNHRPVYYSGRGTGGGHAFVCDGYDSDDMFHFNWGWGGYCDGYYSICNLSPGTGGIGSGSVGEFNDGNMILVGIEPNFGSSINPPTNLTAQRNGRQVTLNWTGASGASSYNVYRNNVLIASEQTGISYVDARMPYGINTYIIRSLDAQGGLSEASNSAQVELVFSAPGNLNVVVNNDESATLTWTTTSNLVDHYNIYCNELLIGTSQTTSFLHSPAPFGMPIYYVRGVDEYGDVSLQSNVVAAPHEFRGPVASNFQAEIDGDDMVLNWTAPISESASLHYGLLANSYGILGYGETNHCYWAQCYPSTMLAQYAGMGVVSVRNFFYEVGNYDVSIFSSDLSDTLAYASFTVENYNSFYTVTFDNPVLIDFENDLWVVFHAAPMAGRSYSAVYTMYSDHDCSNTNYISKNGTRWSQAYTNASWVIEVNISDGTYTYNLYDGSSTIASSLSGNQYTIADFDQNTVHQYSVTTNFFGHESEHSNMVGYAYGNDTISTLMLGDNDKMIITENASLVVEETLSCTNPRNLVLENGAQLVSDSQGVNATVKHNVEGCNDNAGKWHLISLPLNTSVTPTQNNGVLTNSFDLYRYDEGESQEEWQNYENESFELEPATGYLYASQNNAELQFEGVLIGTSQGVDLEYTNNNPHAGWNLIGNPFPCNAYPSQSYYRINAEGTEVSPTLVSDAVPPFAAIFVKATEANQSVGFSKTAPRCAKGDLNITVSKVGSKEVVDRAVVFMNSDENASSVNLPKFLLNNKSTKLAVAYGGKDYAILAMPKETAEIPISFTTNDGGQYLLDIALEGVDCENLILVDNLTGKQLTFESKNSEIKYSFTANSSENAMRFKLQLK